MVKPATPRWLRTPITAFALLVIGLPASAQQAPEPSAAVEVGTPGFDEPMFLPLELRPPSDVVSVGLRFGGKAKVHFTGLGTIPTRWAPGDPADATITSRTYADGTVAPDNRRRPNGNPVGDGLTNNWSFTPDAALVPDTSAGAPAGGLAVVLHSYGAYSAGATADASNGGSLSWDVEYTHRLGGNKVVWGVLFGAGLSDINAKAAGTMKTRLNVISHTYSLNGQPLPAGYTDSYSAPSYTTVPNLDDNGGGSGISSVETSVLLGQKPFSSTDAFAPELVDFYGEWDVRGAFVTTRVGPYVETRLGRRWVVRASAGVTLSIVGARLRVTETTRLMGNVGTLDLLGAETDYESSTQLGVFGEASIEFMLTPRTGLFVGVTYEATSGTMDLVAERVVYNSETYARAAAIKTSAGLALRIGVTAKF